MAALSTSIALNLLVFSTSNPNQNRYLSKGLQHILFLTVLLRGSFFFLLCFVLEFLHISVEIHAVKAHAGNPLRPDKGEDQETSGGYLVGVNLIK